MKTTLLILASVLLLGLPARADILEEGVGIVFGGDHAYSLKAPKGWVLDNESGVDQGIFAAFYPKDGNWADSALVAYARARPKTDKIVTADNAAKASIEDFRANGSPNYEGKRIKTLKTSSGREAVIYHFSGDEWGNLEAVAYFVEEKTINFVVLTSRDAKLFAGSADTFDALVGSYVFLGDKPMAAKKPAEKGEAVKPEPKAE